MNEKGFIAVVLDALVHFLYTLVYLLFCLPFALWKKATYRLYEQKTNGSLKITKIDSIWPFLSFIKTLLFEFIFDAIAFMAYIVGPIMAIVTLIKNGFFGGFVVSLVGVYYFPMLISLFRDLAQMSLLPFRKFLSWVRKPAQQLDIDLRNKN